MTTARELTQRRDYSGDTSIEYGGVWIDLSDWQHGYVTALEVTDLDSGCGFTGAVAVSMVTIMTDLSRDSHWRDQLREILASHGRRTDDLSGDARKHFIAYEAMLYGLCDRESPTHPYGPSCDVIQLDPDGPTQFDGWAAERMTEEEFTAYLESHLWAEPE